MSTEKSEKSVVREYTEAIIVAILLALFIRSFVVQAFKIPSGSMLPTLQVGDHLLVNKFIYGVRVPFIKKRIWTWKKPKRNDVVVFEYPQNPSIDYIKRVVAVEGETVELRNTQLFINGQPIDDPHACYVPFVAEGDLYTVSCSDDPARISDAKSDTSRNISQNSRQNVLLDYGPVRVPPGKLLVMGDNRFHSSDSRFWGFVDNNAILGKAFILYWSWDANDQSFFSAKRWKSIPERLSRIGDIVR